MITHDKLYYFSSSADKPVGKGVHEYITDITKFKELQQINDWRKMLSNFWVAPFELEEGLKYNTVEHIYQGYKLSIVDPNYKYQFSINSASVIGLSSGNEAQKNRKLALLDANQLQRWQQIKGDIVYQALYAKFSQNPDLKRVLLLTGDAELWHG